MKIRLRCPSCTKLYEVANEDIRTEKPLFQCISCEAHFSLEMPESNSQNIKTVLITPEQMGVAAQRGSESSSVEEPAAQESKSCPKCGALNGRRSQECYSCHVLFDRLKGLPQDPSLRAQPSLVRKWKNLLDNFENRDLHEEFISSCYQLEALQFASMKYEELKTAQGGDELCDEMLARIQTLLMVGLAQKTGDSRKAAKTSARPKWSKYVLWAPYVFSALFILMGMMNLGHRNLIGVGVALACMASGLIVMVKGRISLSDFIE